MGKKNAGVLYIRYDKNTVCGQVIENLKEKTPSQTLNKRILRLIFLFEIVGSLNLINVDLRLLNETYYESLRLFSEKLEQTYSKIRQLTEYRASQQNVATISSLVIDSDERKNLAFHPADILVSKDLDSSLIAQSSTSKS